MTVELLPEVATVLLKLSDKNCSEEVSVRPSPPLTVLDHVISVSLSPDVGPVMVAQLPFSVFLYDSELELLYDEPPTVPPARVEFHVHIKAHAWVMVHVNQMS